MKTILRQGPDRRGSSQIRAIGNMQGVLLRVQSGPEPGFDAVAETPARCHLAAPCERQPAVGSTRARVYFMLPSLLDGFGLPAAKAISPGLGPSLGKGEALHEVAGDSAILVDPLNTDEIADGMRLLAHMGHEERQARPPELRQSIARFSRNLAVAAWRSTLQRALAQ